MRSMADVRRVLIVGGGIGGLCTAIALRRAGVEVEIAELNAEWSVYGVGIIQPSNAIRALASLGLGERVVAAGFPFEDSVFHDRDGHVLAEIKAERLAGPEYPPMNGITRPRLHEILTSTARDLGASVRLGVTVESIADLGDDVAVAFTDGTTGLYDLVVGADGIHSLVRRMVFDAELAPQYTGQVCWRYNVPRPPELDGIWMFVGTNGKAGCVPLAPDLMYVLLIEEPPPGEERVEDARLAEVFRERLAEFGGLVGRLRDEYVTDPAAVVLRSVYSILAPRPWYRGRVVLLGDAAHATSPHVGQGAAMAIEDAVVLVEELTRDQPVEAALAAFDQRRYDRCRFIYETSRQIGRWEIERRHDADVPALMHETALVTAAPL
jgi:2-polyprenyl-6-methoxyphenol hydroxylase-like FAD-dependent oxidoreductase